MKPYPLLALLFIPILLPHPVQATPPIPLQTDDGLDPINLIFTGYAPASWVAQNLQGWTPTFCSEPIKTLDGKGYDFNLEAQDQNPPCLGPRYHLRIWDMGTDPVLGHWSVGAVHHEHTECTLVIICQHVIDDWQKAEALVQSTFASGNVALSITSFRLNNTRLYQGIYNDGNATMIQLSPTRMYSVTFQETGLPANTLWSIIMNGTTSSSTVQNITVRSREAAYSYKIGSVPGYESDSSSGKFNLTANRVVTIQFTSTRALQLAADEQRMILLLTTSGVAWSLVGVTAVVKTLRKQRKNF